LLLGFLAAFQKKAVIKIVKRCQSNQWNSLSERGAEPPYSPEFIPNRSKHYATNNIIMGLRDRASGVFFWSERISA